MVFPYYPLLNKTRHWKLLVYYFVKDISDAHDGTIFQRLWDEFAAMLVDENTMENRLARKQLSSPTSF